jgi:hypothetical protein
VLPDEIRVSLEAARREHHRHAVGDLRQRLSEPHVARTPGQSFGKPLRIEANTRGERIVGFPRDDRRAEALEPGKRVVETFPDHALQVGVTSRALLPEALEIPVAPDDAAREVHRSARPVALLMDDDSGAELPRTGGCDQAGHPRPRDDEVGQSARRARKSACARRTRA